MTATSTDRTSSRYWHDRAAHVKPETGLFIDGRFVNSASGARFQTLNPATRQVLAEVAQGTAKDVDLAVAAARKAFRSGSWSRMAPRSRMEILYKVARLMEQHADDLALLDCLDMGKPISEMVSIDVPGSVLTWQFFAETIDKIEGSVTNTDPSAPLSANTSTTPEPATAFRRLLADPEQAAFVRTLAFVVLSEADLDVVMSRASTTFCTRICSPPSSWSVDCGNESRSTTSLGRWDAHPLR